jgi:copper chaperone
MVRFHIPNMACGGCAKGVGATLREADPHAAFDIDLDRRQVAVTSAMDESVLQAALTEAGWQAARVEA